MIRPQTCPICQRAVSPAVEEQGKFLPFCSERRRQVDLLRWSEGKYSIVEPLDAGELDEEPPPDREA